MSRLIPISGLISLLLLGCSEVVGPFDCATDTPDWLKTKLESLSSGYWGTTVYRYEWRGEPVYHFEVPVSSCAYCELYGQDGERLQFADQGEFEDFLANKENETLICEWSD
jgi:hypothetical protein